MTNTVHIPAYDEVLKGGITTKKLISWLNLMFQGMRFKKYEVFEIKRTGYSSNQTQSGAYKLHIKFRDISLPKDALNSTGYFVSYWSVKEIQELLNDNYYLCIKDKSNLGILSQFELDVSKL